MSRRSRGGGLQCLACWDTICESHIVGGVSPDIWAAHVADPYGAHGLLHYEQFLPPPLVAFHGFKNINKWLAPKLPPYTTVPLPTLLAPRPGIDGPHMQFILRDGQEPIQIFVRLLHGALVAMNVVTSSTVLDFRSNL